MTSSARLDTFRQMVARDPNNALARFGLANEALKAELWEEAREQLERYLALHDDEGNAYGRLAEALVRLDRVDEAREVLRKGITTSHRCGHPSMAAEFESRLEELEDA